MIGIVHGYGLGGAGSNLWTREAVSALCDNGETVHLMCQEPSPERFDFVTELHVYDENGEPEQRFRRESDRPGRCIIHKPSLNVLPTYVRPDRPSDYVRSILDLDDDTLEEYVARNVAALRRVARDHDVTRWHVNHTILLSEALRRLQAEGVLRFAIMPHGSALEYVVKHDDRMRAVARNVLAAADRIFSLNQEVRDRLADYFPDLELEPKTVTVRVGVNTERFRPVPRLERAASVQRLARALGTTPRGRTPDQAATVRVALDRADTHDQFQTLLEPALDYPAGPDADLEARLESVDWEEDPVIAFVGRLIPAKGVPALVAAFPLILEEHPDARLLLVGTGWLREYLEAFTLALAHGDADRVRSVIGWMGERAQEGARPFADAFLRSLQEQGRFDAYVDGAARSLDPQQVLFTGFLEHHLLAHVFPLADVAVFPSAVAEASPLVIPEAAACGCMPMGTYFAGMKHSLDSLAPRLPESLRPLMNLRPEPEHTAFDIASNVSATLHARHDVSASLRDAAVQEYDWRTIAGTLAREIRGLTTPATT